jgi:AcrR family transcriptional regulator
MSSTARQSTPRTSSRLTAGDWVDAALELIGEDGLAAVKIDRLARRLGATKGSFYWHFADLATFMDEVAAMWCTGREEMRGMLDALDELPPRERLGRLTELLHDTRYWRLERASREWARTNPRVREMLDQSDRWIVDAERKAFVELGFPTVEARLRANTLFYAGMGFILAGPDDGRLDRRQTDGLIDLLTTVDGDSG